MIPWKKGEIVFSLARNCMEPSDIIETKTLIRLRLMYNILNRQLEGMVRGSVKA